MILWTRLPARRSCFLIFYLLDYKVFVICNRADIFYAHTMRGENMKMQNFPKYIFCPTELEILRNNCVAEQWIKFQYAEKMCCIPEFGQKKWSE